MGRFHLCLWHSSILQRISNNKQMNANIDILYLLKWTERIANFLGDFLFSSFVVAVYFLWIFGRALFIVNTCGFLSFSIMLCFFVRYLKGTSIKCCKRQGNNEEIISRRIEAKSIYTEFFFCPSIFIKLLASIVSVGKLCKKRCRCLHHWNVWIDVFLFTFRVVVINVKPRNKKKVTFRWQMSSASIQVTEYQFKIELIFFGSIYWWDYFQCETFSHHRLAAKW